jgi:alpha-tubulin suppressor-like RCC1 family protein
MRIRLEQMAASLAIVIGMLGGVATAASAAPSPSNPVNNWGQISNGFTPHLVDDSPRPVGTLSDASVIQASNGNSYAVAAGVAYAWGFGQKGALGDGSTDDSFAPVKISFPSATHVVALGDAENAGFAIDSSGRAWAWGWDKDGDLCDDNPNSSVDTPINISSQVGAVTAVVGAAHHVLWLTTAGTVETCGLNSDGELGTGTTRDASTPVTVVGLPVGDPVVAISAGNLDSAALTASGKLFMWGYNGTGALGIDNTTNQDTPQQVPGTWSQVYAGGSIANNTHTVAITATGTVDAWGANLDGQLGDGNTTDTDVPTAVSVPAGVTFSTVVAGGSVTAALDSNHNVWTWGANGVGQLGDGHAAGMKKTPVKVDSGRTLLSSTAGNVLDG